jgi:transmembrane protein 33
MIAYQPSAIWAVSRAEVWIIFPMTILTIFWGGTSLFTPFLYQQFLQFRFLSSPMTRQVFSEVEVTFDKWILNQPQSPEWIKSGYVTVKELIKKYGNLEARARAQASPPTQ